MARGLTILLLVCFNLACSNSGMFGASNKPAGDGKRPTETGEGVPGYLTDPDLVSISRDQSKVSVVGQAGAVAPQNASIENLDVCLFMFDPSDLEGATLYDGSGVATDGSFALTAAEASPSLRAAVQVALGCDKLLINTQTESQALYETEGGLFSKTTDSLLPESFKCSEHGTCKLTLLAFEDISGKLTDLDITLNFPIDCEAANPKVLDNEGCSDGEGMKFGYQVGDERSNRTFEAEECSALNSNALRDTLKIAALEGCRKAPRYALGRFTDAKAQLDLPQKAFFLNATGTEGSTYYAEFSENTVSESAGTEILIPFGVSSH